jgi:hypothetical protein
VQKRSGFEKGEKVIDSRTLLRSYATSGGSATMSNPTTIEPRRASWRMLITGCTVWAPFGDHGWRPGIITGLGKNRGDNTIVHLHFETGGKGKRLAGELYWAQAGIEGQGQTGGTGG